MVVRCLVIVVAVCLFGTSVNALTMQECRAQYKAHLGHGPKGGALIRAAMIAHRADHAPLQFIVGYLVVKPARVEDGVMVAIRLAEQAERRIL
jgi:hypothetical protein